MQNITYQDLARMHDDLAAIRALQLAYPDSNVELCAIHNLAYRIEKAERELGIAN